jgi:polysaccharide biosynthesis protein PelC
MMKKQNNKSAFLKALFVPVLIFFFACASTEKISTQFHSQDMDFASLRTVAVMPFSNLTRDNQAADRVRDTFINNLLSTGSLYVVPSGEVARGIARVLPADAASPSGEETERLAAAVKADALITGVVREYGEVRSGSTSSNVISISVRMIEAGSQKIVWSASSTKGGISIKDRLLGGGGRPMDEITEEAVNDLINKLFQVPSQATAPK